MSVKPGGSLQHPPRNISIAPPNKPLPSPEHPLTHMRNNSTRQKGKKKIQLHNFKVSSTTVWRYMTNKGWKAVKRKRRRTRRNGAQGFGNFIAKDDRSTNSRDVDPLHTKIQPPNTLDELRQWLRFAWKNVPSDTLWQPIHSVPHHLWNVR